MLGKYILSILFGALALMVFANDGDEIDFKTSILPLLEKKCNTCHRAGPLKGGVNTKRYQEEERVVKDGRFWFKALNQIKTREMPPSTEPVLTDEEYHILVDGIENILRKALKNQNPGSVVARRLSHTEYKHTVMDLTGVEFDARLFFPSDGSGGGGFDNQGKALFITPLKLERYYDAATIIVADLYRDAALWKKVVPKSYKLTFWMKFTNWFKGIIFDNYQETHTPDKVASESIIPFASKAFRRYLKLEEKEKLMTFFSEVYQHKDTIKNPQRFNESIMETLKVVLVSPNFIYRAEEESDKKVPFELNDFELASRLSYFIWSSMPDEELFELARQEKLHDTLVIAAQVKRMLKHPKAKRFAESFSSQWLEIGELIEPKPIVDPEKFPEFNTSLRKSMFQETVDYFYHVLTESKDFSELLNGNYTFLNEELADFYGLDPIKGDTLRMVMLDNPNRGGVLGMGSVLTTTSLPTRTSPVLRGKWVLEQILGQPPPPPPPNVGEIPEDAEVQKNLGLRALLEIHRSKPECVSCHEKMDPIGLGLENFDAIGRWRTSYGEVEIDPSGVLGKDGAFQGPAELKTMISNKREAFALNLSKKMLSYAVGRSILFTDQTIIEELQTCLLENDFHTEKFIIELVKSYPFRLKKNDFRKKANEV
ncbi:MAG: DUF1592 domain-containing protein [Cyclobacteriaceae bacterium]